MLGEAFHSHNCLGSEFLTLGHLREDAGKSVATLLRIISALDIYSQKAIKFYHFAVGSEMLLACGGFDFNSGFLNLRIGHLRSHGALPYKVVETFLLRGAVNSAFVGICGADSFVSLLSAL